MLSDLCYAVIQLALKGLQKQIGEQHFFINIVQILNGGKMRVRLITFNRIAFGNFLTQRNKKVSHYSQKTDIQALIK